MGIILVLYDTESGNTGKMIQYVTEGASASPENRMRFFFFGGWGTWRLGDLGTWDWETWRLGDLGTGRLGDWETWGLGDLGTWGLGD